MPSGSASDGTWLSLLDEKKQHVRESFGPDYKFRRIGNRRAFRSALEKLCSREREYQPPQILTTIVSSVYPVAQFAKAIDESALQHLSSEEGLEGLIWDTSFALIEYGCNKLKTDPGRSPIRPLVHILARLFRSFPQFSIDVVGQFPADTKVQQPLREVYDQFIEAQMVALTHLRQTAEASHESLESMLDPHIDATNQQLEKARGLHSLMVKQAAEDLERKRAEQSQPGLKDLSQLPDLLHPHSGSDRAIPVRFISKRVLGCGSYAEVDEVAEASTGALYARKCIHIDPSKSAGRREEEVKKEVAIMQKLRHMHITTVLFHAKFGETYSIFMTPVADCDLQVFLKRCAEEKFPTRKTKHMNRWFGCLMDALAYAHKCKIKHQDIKPGNILIKENTPYLSDFGLAKDFALLDESASRSEKIDGSVMYRAPEVEPLKERGRKADVFSLGCVFSEMFTVTQEKSVDDYCNARGSPIYKWCLPSVKTWLERFESNSKLDDLLKDEILEMMQEKADDRPTSLEALNIFKRYNALFCVENL